MSDYGAKMARRFAGELAKNGVTVVSGMAKGIDGVAHQAAIDAGGRTIAVLGSGIDVVYPREHEKLYELIIKNGAVVSEFPAGTAPLPKNFLQRNRLIAALSKVVLVVEGQRRSGTLSIANHAANLGVDVFAIPGRVDSALSELPNYLIESGAGVARKPQDILDVLR
jgi:DNA processing protein